MVVLPIPGLGGGVIGLPSPSRIRRHRLGRWDPSARARSHISIQDSGHAPFEGPPGTNETLLRPEKAPMVDFGEFAGKNLVIHLKKILTRDQGERGTRGAYRPPWRQPRQILSQSPTDATSSR